MNNFKTKGFGLVVGKAVRPINEAETSTGTTVNIYDLDVRSLNFIARKYQKDIFGTSGNKIAKITNRSEAKGQVTYTVSIEDKAGKQLGTEKFKLWTVFTFDGSVNFNWEQL